MIKWNHSRKVGEGEGMFNSNDGWDVVCKIIAILAIIGGTSLLVGVIYLIYWLIQNVPIIIK